MSEPWYKRAVFYEIYVRAYADSNGDGHGDLRGLMSKLDYLKDLGVDCIWLLPIYPSPLRDDGYDIADYYGVLKEYGTLEDFKALIAAVHARGMRLIADLVMNHTSDQHPWFQAARSSRQSPYRDYYVWSDTDQSYPDARIIFTDTEKSNWTWDPLAGQYFWHRFFSSQPDLNFDNPAVREEMKKIAEFWMEMGIDGFRTDAVPYLFEREGTNCENLPETHAYLKEIRRFMDERYPDCILLCEANQWPEDVRPYFGDGDEFHMGFHFPAMPRIFKSIRAGRADSLIEILNRTPPIPENTQWCTFLRNHDELTLEMVSEEDRQWMWNEYAPEARMRLNLGIRRRLAPLLDNDSRKLALANSLLFTLLGSPILYYGDEIGMGDNIWMDDRNGVRTPMQWSGETNAGFSGAAPEKLYAKLIDDPLYGYQMINVAAQQNQAGSHFERVKKMVATYKQHPALATGAFEWADVSGNLALAAFWRSGPAETILALHNLRAEPQPVKPGGKAYKGYRDLFSGEVIQAGMTLSLEPYGYRWLEALLLNFRARDKTMNASTLSTLTPAGRSFSRLRPRLEARFKSAARSRAAEWKEFSARLDQHFPRLFDLLLELYGTQYDFFYHLEELLAALAESWLERPAELKALDRERDTQPDWFQSNQMAGGVVYVDLFAGDLGGLRQHIPYFKELGLTYLHLMPLFKVPEPENDGGYAISSYREVNPRLGTMAQLAELARELRQNGISLVLDFVFNHTSDQHEWALQAKAGDPEFQDYYRMFPDRHMPDEYEKTLREIFPDEHPGAFTYFPEIGKWVWTTFHSYQWDLNYQNPAVFTAMTRELLALANVGVQVLRLDAVAFTWKETGTSCENLPGAHRLIQAFNAAMRIAAPALLFKSEAIVHPDEVAKYIHPQECQLSYNPLLMALLWESLATRDVSLLSTSMRERFHIPEGTAWVNYVRCHDDIGWTFDDADAARVGINGYNHRRFLNDFYTGRFEGSFARGLPFQENPKTGDCRISGTCASLAGLEKALLSETEREVDLAVRRILLIHTLILTIGGIPLLYLGDEIGTLNDYSFRDQPGKERDSRWVHRPVTDWQRMERRHRATTSEGRIYTNLRRLIEMRQSNPVFSGAEFQWVDAGHATVFAFLRSYQGRRVLVLANFSEQAQTLPANLLRLYGLSYHFNELISGQVLEASELSLRGYEVVCLEAK